MLKAFPEPTVLSSKNRTNYGTNYADHKRNLLHSPAPKSTKRTNKNFSLKGANRWGNYSRCPLKIKPNKKPEPRSNELLCIAWAMQRTLCQSQNHNTTALRTGHPQAIFLPPT